MSKIKRPRKVPTASLGELTLLPLEEVQAVLGVSRAVLYRMMEGGRMPFIQVEGRRRIRASALQDYINANAVGGDRAGKRG
jgi:excisionase family DNA binding protein